MGTFNGKTVSVIGLGYIGLPTAALFASRQVTVIGVDVNPHAVETINKGSIHIFEPDLDGLVHATVTSGHLRAVATPEAADAFLVTVPTPFQGAHEPDLSYVEAASRSVAKVLQKGNLVILESTVPVGATEQMAKWMAEERPDLSFPHQAGEEADIQVAHCPERVLPGKVLHELVENDRVIGGMTPRCAKAAKTLYEVFVRGELVLTDTHTAELAKLTENAFRDVNIAFANELSLICDRLGIDVWELIELANRHPRVNILRPGVGVGGHCIAVDPWFIVSATPEQAQLIHTARRINDGKRLHVLEQIRQQMTTHANEKPVVACLGLAFKPDIDDLRESPALQLVEDLAAEGHQLAVVEPNIKTLPSSLAGRPNVTLLPLEEALAQADIITVLVGHHSFLNLQANMVQGKTVMDFVGAVRHLTQR